MSVVKLPLEAIDPVTGLPSGADLSVDVNSTDSVAVYDVGRFDYLSIQGIKQSGTWTTGTFTVYFSNTGFTTADYEDALGSKGTTPTFTGSTLGLNDLFCKGFRYAVVKVSTAQGGAGTCALNAWGSAEGGPGRAGRVAAGTTGETTPPPGGPSEGSTTILKPSFPGPGGGGDIE